MAVPLHRLSAEAPAVHRELDLVAIAVAPDADLLTFPRGGGGGPVRVEVEHRLVGPPGFQVIEAVLGKAAEIEDAGMRTDLRPAVGIGFAAVVKTRPEEHAGEIRAGGVVLPAGLDVPS